MLTLLARGGAGNGQPLTTGGYILMGIVFIGVLTVIIMNRRNK